MSRFAQFRWYKPGCTLLVVPLVLFAACGDGADDSPDDGDGAAVEAQIDGLVEERVGDYTHLLGHIAYEEPAPSGGDHPPAPYWITCGAYDGEVPAELVVHSLEHGAVWIALGPDSTPEDRAAAEELADGRKVIVSDVADLANPVEVVAWGFRLPLESVSDERAERFVDRFVDAPTAPEAGLSCASEGSPPTPPTWPPPA
jgi:hypothetical protein